MSYLVDSDVLIDVSRGNVGAKEFLDSLEEGWAISQVSTLELLVGARNQLELRQIDAFLSRYLVMPLHNSIGTRAYRLIKQYAKSHGLHVFDSLIAATALEERLTVVTKNRKHFSMIEELRLVVPGY